MAISVANINTTTDTFGQWVDKTNIILTELGDRIVTTNSNTTVGNSSITGNFSANSADLSTSLNVGINSTFGVSITVGNSTVNSTFTSTQATLANVTSASITSNGNITISKNTPTLVLNAIANNNSKRIEGRTNNSVRWTIDLGNEVQETGSNAGSNFEIKRYDDLGNLLSSVFTINRANGIITMTPSVSIANTLSMNTNRILDVSNGVANTDAATVGQVVLRNGSSPMIGDLIISKNEPRFTLNKSIVGQTNYIQGTTNNSIRWGVALGNDIAESGNNAGNDFQIDRHSDTGSYLGSPIVINRDTGITTFSAIPVGPASNPTTDNQLSRKAYVDAQRDTRLALLGGTLTGDLNISKAGPVLNLAASSGTASIEVGGSTAAFLDLKVPSSDNFDLRLITTGNGGIIQTTGGTIDISAAGVATFSAIPETPNSPTTDNQLSRKAYVDAQRDTRLPLTGGTLTGDLFVNKVEPRFILNKTASGQGSFIVATTNGAARWVVSIGNGTAESGGNAGSDFVLDRYGDDGGYLGTPLYVARNTGSITLDGFTSINSSAFVRGDLVNTNGSVRVRGGSNRHVWFENEAGVEQGLVFHDSTSGEVRIRAAAGPEFRVNGWGNVFAPNFVWAPNGLRGGPADSGTLMCWNATNSVNFRWDGQLFYRVDEVAERRIATAENGQFFGYASGTAGPHGVSLNGFDLAGTVYGIFVDAVSDQRLKENIAPTVHDALATVRAIPVREFAFRAEVAAHFAGVGKSAEEREALKANAEPAPVRIGFVAQELREIVPEAVSVLQQPPVEGSPLPADMHTIVQQQLVPYLVRAIQQQQEQIEALMARIEKLEKNNV